MALSLANIEIELREILLKDRPESLFSISAKGTVPVLQTNEKVIDESLDIMFWAFNKTKILTRFLSKIELQEEIIHRNDHKFKTWLDRYKYNNRYDDYPLEKCKIKSEEILDIYELSLSKNNYLLGDSLMLVDIAIFPFVRQYANIDLVYFISKFPNIKNWLDKISESELFMSVMKKYPQWKLGDFPKIIKFKNEFI